MPPPTLSLLQAWRCSNFESGFGAPLVSEEHSLIAIFHTCQGKKWNRSTGVCNWRDIAWESVQPWDQFEGEPWSPTKPLASSAYKPASGLHACASMNWKQCGGERWSGKQRWSSSERPLNTRFACFRGTKCCLFTLERRRISSRGITPKRLSRQSLGPSCRPYRIQRCLFHLNHVIQDFTLCVYAMSMQALEEEMAYILVYCNKSVVVTSQYTARFFLYCGSWRHLKMIFYWIRLMKYTCIWLRVWSHTSIVQWSSALPIEAWIDHKLEFEVQWKIIIGE
jgi:hypothetical protein